MIVQCFLIPVTFSSHKEALCVSLPHCWHVANISLSAASSPSLETRPTGSIPYFCVLSLLKTDTKMCLFSLTLCYDPSIAGHWWSGRRMVSWRQLVADASHSLGRRDSQDYKYINTHRLIPAAVEALTVCVSPPGPAKAVAMRRPLSSLPMPSGSNFQICFIFAISSFSPTADFFQQSSVSKREFTKKLLSYVAMIFLKNCWHS